jgi:hypothetical protein
MLNEIFPQPEPRETKRMVSFCGKSFQLICEHYGLMNPQIEVTNNAVSLRISKQAENSSREK